jgi:hypothetical protein
MIRNRTLAAVAALAIAAGTIGGAATAASAAGVSVTFGVAGDQHYPPPGDRGCWRWVGHQWAWTCHRAHPHIMFDMHTHKWH